MRLLWLGLCFEVGVGGSVLVVGCLWSVGISCLRLCSPIFEGYNYLPSLRLRGPILELRWPILEAMLPHLGAMFAHLQAYVGPC